MIIGELFFWPAECEKALYQIEDVFFVNGTQHTDYCWFSHDVTKIQTTKLSILQRLYFHGVLEQLLPKTIDRPPEWSWKTLDIAVSLEK